jgi:hypothetical protein
MSDNHHISDNKPKLPSHYAYSVREGKDDKAHFTKIGAAWTASDDGLTVSVDAMPLDGKIHLRSREALARMRNARQQHTQEQNGHSPSEHDPKLE